MINDLIYMIVDGMSDAYDSLNFTIIAADDVFPFSVTLLQVILAFSIIALLLDALQFGDEDGGD